MNINLDIVLYLDLLILGWQVYDSVIVCSCWIGMNVWVGVNSVSECSGWSVGRLFFFFFFFFANVSFTLQVYPPSNVVSSKIPDPNGDFWDFLIETTTWGCSTPRYQVKICHFFCPRFDPLEQNQSEAPELKRWFFSFHSWCSNVDDCPRKGIRGKKGNMKTPGL